MERVEATTGGQEKRRLGALVRGAVQGVGFRPFVYRLAAELGLAGWVSNTGQGVRLEVEGPADRVERFLLRLAREAPPRAFIQGMEHLWLEPVGYAGFEIRPSAVRVVRMSAAPDPGRRRADRPGPARHRHLPRLPA